VGAIAIGDMIKSTLGPKGMVGLLFPGSLAPLRPTFAPNSNYNGSNHFMSRLVQDKILQSMSNGNIMVTNDGATILKSIALDNPAAKVLVNISKVQDDEVGDGTTSVCVLASELLKEAEKLVAQKIHPQTIIEGFRMASDVARKTLEAAAIDNRSVVLACGRFGAVFSFVCELETSKDPEQFREDLLNIARTTLSSKVLSGAKDYFSKLAVDAVLRLKVRGRHLKFYTTPVHPLNSHPGEHQSRAHPDHQEVWWASRGLLLGRGLHSGQAHRREPAEANRKRQNHDRQHSWGLLERNGKLTSNESFFYSHGH